MYCLLRYYKEQTQIAGLFFKKGVLELVVKFLDKYTSKEFLKFLSKTELLHRYFSRILITNITAIV